MAEILIDHPGAAKALAALGINHCCGAHLSLEEAAAAAGVSVAVVLEALDHAREEASS